MAERLYNYTKNYCEENIWHLCQHPDLKSLKKKVLIISNETRNCSFWHQKSMLETDPVCWDYHVVLLVFDQGMWSIYDLDSSLELPVPLDSYLNLTFGPANENSENAPYFKSFSSAFFTNAFSSDRSHMKDEAGNWIFSPPSWPKIEQEHSLGLFMKEITDFSLSSPQKIISMEELKTTFLPV
ncbi:hypothetical protein [Cyclobacterium jeungdonense]|uniref:Protein N-terminal glutamine amidohydrolase n=1 Tax=Cyclobacterium jeungdonense TaxID=708087 RepID=A0ABT8CCG7_9BACT|nr:hypothetical protein [Cyclobacterium jeungdonense]MDN3690081.1 hypothetical protein [Cyclobacterium jeungdonense]